MADNLTTTTTVATIPNATVIATDQLVGGEHVQIVKLADGTADSSTRIVSGNGVAAGALRVTLASDGTGTVIVTDGGGSLTVDGTFWQATQPVSGPLTDAQLRATAVPVSGTVTAISGTATNLKAEVIGTGTFAVQADTELTTADLDTGAGTDTRAVVGVVLAKSGGAANVSSSDPLPVTVISGASNTQFAEDAGHTTGDTGTVALAVRTDTPLQRAGTDGDYSVLETDVDGRLWTNTGVPRARKLFAQGTITSSTAETTVIGAVGSESHDLYQIILTNTSTTGTKVSVRDALAGTVREVLYVPALSTVGWSLDLTAAVPQTAQNAVWSLQCGTSVASIEYTLRYIKVT